MVFAILWITGIACVTAGVIFLSLCIASGMSSRAEEEYHAEYWQDTPSVNCGPVNTGH